MPNIPRDLILGEIAFRCRINSLLALRLVSKSWRDSCSEYSGAISVSVKCAAHLSHLCRILPSLTELSASGIADSTDLSCLSNCSLLTKLSLWGRPYDALVNLAALPKTLRALHLEGLWGQPGCLEHIKFVGLTQFWLGLPKPVELDPHDLLERLPDLQVYISQSSFKRLLDCSACQT